jgi:hypothetical protein
MTYTLEFGVAQSFVLVNSCISIFFLMENSKKKKKRPEEVLYKIVTPEQKINKQ